MNPREWLKELERYLQLMPEKEYRKYYVIARTRGLSAASDWRRARIRREFLRVLIKRTATRGRSSSTVVGATV